MHQQTKVLGQNRTIFLFLYFHKKGSTVLGYFSKRINFKSKYILNIIYQNAEAILTSAFLHFNNYLFAIQLFFEKIKGILTSYQTK